MRARIRATAQPGPHKVPGEQHQPDLLRFDSPEGPVLKGHVTVDCFLPPSRQQINCAVRRMQGNEKHPEGNSPETDERSPAISEDSRESISPKHVVLVRVRRLRQDVSRSEQPLRDLIYWTLFFMYQILYFRYYVYISISY